MRRQPGKGEPIMPSTYHKQKRKELLRKYKDGQLSTKTKLSLGFPVEIDQAFQPHWVDDTSEIKRTPPPKPKETPPKPEGE
jgi:hypothetical protein